MTLERWWLWFLTLAAMQMPLPHSSTLQQIAMLLGIFGAFGCLAVCTWRHVIKDQP